jgi:ketosteroid isomerase-like protein
VRHCRTTPPVRPAAPITTFALLITFCLLAACAGGAAPPLDAAALQRIEQEIRDAEAQFNGAYERNDMPAYWAFYDDALTQWFDTGRMSLEEYRKEWEGMLQAGGAVLENRIEDMRVRVGPQGDAAVASYKVFVRLRNAEGKETGEWYHETDSWMKLDGRWKVVHLHYSRAAAPAPEAAPAGAQP